MFTGLIQHVGTISSATPSANGRRLVVDPQGWAHQPAIGDSIAIAGCCLTLVQGPPAMLAFDVIPQTLDMTTLGTLAVGRRVNVEAAMRADARLDGHVVQGHVDAMGTVVAVTQDAESGIRIRVQVPERVSDLCVGQGAITIDGVNLTIADLGDDWMEVALIPTTLQDTTLGTIEAGDTVNVETDVLARHVARLVERHMERLMDGRIA